MSSPVIINIEPICSQVFIQGNQKAIELSQPGKLLAGRSTAFITVPTYIATLSIGLLESLISGIYSFGTAFFSCFPSCAIQQEYANEYMNASRETVKTMGTHVMNRGIVPLNLPSDIDSFAHKFHVNSTDSTTIELYNPDSEVREYQQYLASLIQKATQKIFARVPAECRTDILFNKENVREPITLMAQFLEIKDFKENRKCPGSETYHQRSKKLCEVFNNYTQLESTQKKQIEEQVFQVKDHNLDKTTKVVHAQIEALAAELTNNSILKCESITCSNSGEFTRRSVDLVAASINPM